LYSPGARHSARPPPPRAPSSSPPATTVRRITYTPANDGAEVVLIRIEGAGHTWPGHPSPIKFLGKSTTDIDANDLIWDFFVARPMK
jgi:polyhydroxybutyrate depolymerase